MNLWADVVQSPYFDSAVELIKRHGISTNTAPGISTSICREVLKIDFRTSKAPDVPSFMESIIAHYKGAIGEVIKEKLENVEKVSQTDVVMNWVEHYSEPHPDSMPERKRKIFFDDNFDFNDSFEAMKSVWPFEVDSESENSLADPDGSVVEVKSDKLTQQKQAAFDALEKLAMLEESFCNPTSGKKRAKTRH